MLSFYWWPRRITTADLCRCGPTTGIILLKRALPENFFVKNRTPCYMLDALLSKLWMTSVDLVKIDADRHEHKMLDGMAKVFESTSVCS